MTGKFIFNFLIVVVVLILLYFGYGLLRGGNAPTDTTGGATSLTASGFADGSIGDNPADEFLTTLTGLKELNLRGEIFGHPVFKDLVESPLVLPEGNPGRPNPFAPVNFSSFSSASHATSTTATSTRSSVISNLRAP